MRVTNYFSWILFLSILFGIGCQENFLNRLPKDNPSNETFFTNETELQLALTSAYRIFHWRNSEPYNLWPLLDGTSDIVWLRWNMAGLQSVGAGAHASNSGLANHKWVHHYRNINKVNNMLDNIGKVEGKVPETTLNKIIAQAKFIRAFGYYELTEFFGDVPLIQEVLSYEESEVPRTSKDQVVDFILSELDAVAQNLPVSWPDSEVGRVTKGTALALKARVALFNKRYAVAEQAAKAVMDLGVYELYPNYYELFTYVGENSEEAILSVQFDQDSDHWLPQNQLTRMAGGWSQMVPTQSLIDSYLATDGEPIDESSVYDPEHPFENRDPRLDQTIVRPGSEFMGYIFYTHPDSVMTTHIPTGQRVENQDVTNPYATFTGYNMRKYMDETDLSDRQSSRLNFMLIRYAEVLLTYAEAKIEQNEIDQSVYDAINEIRNRPSVMMPNISSPKTQQELRTILRTERKVELAYEGLRYFDIRRWGIAEEVMSGPVLGRPRRDFGAVSIPSIDENGTPHYSSDPSLYRSPETRIFDPNRDYLLPIPQSEMDVNDNLAQNPGY